jgi:hypothetical protein
MGGLAGGGGGMNQEPFTSVDERINRNYTYHAPKGNQVERYQAIRDSARSLAELIIGASPASREQSLALTNVEQAVMWANAAIARNE